MSSIYDPAHLLISVSIRNLLVLNLRNEFVDKVVAKKEWKLDKKKEEMETILLSDHKMQNLFKTILIYCHKAHTFFLLIRPIPF